MLRTPGQGGKTDTFETQPSTYDPGTGLLRAVLPHFSDWTVGISVQAGRIDPWKMTPNQGSVSLFRGSVNFS